MDLTLRVPLRAAGTVKPGTIARKGMEYRTPKVLNTSCEIGR